MTNFRKLSKVDGISKKNKSSGKKGHVGHIFALAISSDSKYLVIYKISFKLSVLVLYYKLNII